MRATSSGVDLAGILGDAGAESRRLVWVEGLDMERDIPAHREKESGEGT